MLRTAFLKFLFFLSVLSLGGSLVYYLGTVTQLALIIITILSVILTIVAPPRIKRPVGLPKIISPIIGPLDAALIATSLIGLMGWWQAVAPVLIDDSVRSPWLVVPSVSLLWLGLSAAALSMYAMREKASGAIIFILGLGLLWSAVTMAAVIYPLGYGFDPFLHRATIQHIIEHGTITPKPLYYIGEYALELVATMVFNLPLRLVDTWLVPLLASLIFAGSAWIGLRRAFLPAIFLFPLSIFIVTTPQSLSLALLGSLLFLSLPELLDRKDRVHPLVLALVALFAAVVHPLSGIPALGYLALVLAQRLPRYQKIATVTLLLGCVLSIPMLFLWRSGLGIHLGLPNAQDWLDLLPGTYLKNGHHAWLDVLYLVSGNLFWLIFGFAIYELWQTRRESIAKHLPTLTALAWLASYDLLILFFNFDFLIDYERQDYSGRLMVMATIFLIPGAVLGLYRFAQRITDDHIKTVLAATMMSLLAMNSIYVAYPRHDNYTRSGNFNVSLDDKLAVQMIDGLAGEDDYAVLANQAVASTAVEAFGFVKYYPGDIFYYPIPTGGPLYALYLEMMAAPSRTPIDEAFALTGADRVYLVVNDYWWESKSVILTAKTLTDSWYTVGTVTIFEFGR